MNRTVYYFLEGYDLREIEIESVNHTDEHRTEVTLKAINTDEGGNKMESNND